MYPKLCMCKSEHSFLRRAFFRFIITFLHNSHHTKNQINKSSLPSISNYLKKYYKPHPLPIGRIKMGASPATFHSLKKSPFCELILTPGFYDSSLPAPTWEIHKPYTTSLLWSWDTLAHCFPSFLWTAIMMMTIYIYLLLFIYWYIFSLFFSHLCFCLPKSLWKVFEGSHCVICLYPYLLPSWILSRNGGRKTLRAKAGTRLAEPMEWGVCLDKHSPCPWEIINLHPPVTMWVDALCHFQKLFFQRALIIIDLVGY